MRAFLIRRLLSMVVSFFIISLVVFIVVQLPPGDFASNLETKLLISRDITEEAAREIAEKYRVLFNLDEPMWRQYVAWLMNFLRGEMGMSLQYLRPVSQLLGERLALSFGISFASLLFTWAIGLPIGIYSATHKNSLGDHAATFVGFVGLSVPNFFLALVLMVVGLYVFNLPVGRIFSSAYEGAPWSLGKAFDLIKNLWIAVVVIGTAGTAGTIRVMRGNLLDVLGQPFVTTARSKGLSEPVVIRRHSVRIAFNPFITSLGLNLPELLSGEVITSIVLNLPTAGPLLFEALLQEDIYMAASILQFFGVVLLIGNLLADIGLAWLDPRIRYD